MSLYVDAFPISAKLKERLKRRGFSCIEDFVDVKVKDLVEEVEGIKSEDAAWVLDYCRQIKDPFSSVQPVSAWSLLLSSSSSPSRITTFSQSLDCLLDGGVPLGSVTEICGAPGVGKTQVTIQLAVNALIPEVFEGVGGRIGGGGGGGGGGREVVESDQKHKNTENIEESESRAFVYVFDTEGSFVPQRIFEIAEATVGHFKRLVGTLDPEEDREAIDQANAMSVTEFCDQILISRCLSLEELLAGVKHLRAVAQHRRISLIVIDSLAMHFRQELQDLALRTRVLNGLVQDLLQIAVGNENLKGAAIVLTNQMTTKIYSDRHKSSHLIPALGESWGHAPTHRLLLHWGQQPKPQSQSSAEQQSRLATIFKSPSRPEQCEAFKVTSGGVRDVECQSGPKNADCFDEMDSDDFDDCEINAGGTLIGKEEKILHGNSDSRKRPRLS